MAKGAIERITNIMRSNVNDLLNRLEDPEKMVHQVIRDMEEDVDRAVEAVSKAVANQRRLEKQEEQLKADIEKWQEKAERAVEEKDEEYARRALQQKADLIGALDELAPVLEESRQTTAQLRDQLKELRSRLQDARNRQGNLIARYKTVRMRQGEKQEEVVEVENDPFARFQRIEQQVQAHEGEFARFQQKVDTAAAEADLYREMAESRTSERELQEMDRQKKVEEELAALRGKVNKES